MQHDIRLRRGNCSQTGFSLVELITVVILIGVLSVVAATRFQTRKGYVEYAYQDRLITALRNMQTRAMQDTRSGFCFRINLAYGTASAYGPPSLNYAPGNGSATCASGISTSAPGYLAVQAAELAAESVVLSSADGNYSNFSYLAFDALGRPLNGAANCNTGRPCRITLTGESSVQVCVESQGYVHAC
ncbi:type II secretion system protein [Aestuariibacter sp. GS-14]|uniref:type IV pilin protein n=1 Tax=Aestuariibacter sp. GS-14 TaxID=2590670 RepID=UPI00112B340B|nr:type II secretion system protein [Aestuariibacter sp. GS-14]TPV57315.1 type II secretion system protein [Aestuariibacter sp. GS-14]